ncbi:LysE family translocator [Cronobacter dublinensis]|uniref:LysE family translocator n=1 Tax=Cronobacter dublinensis TaxID=413497 RepID=UPI000CFB40E0|nr:LysE family transporter [Cronobacter dublinensis]EKY3088117.1 LysE family transporter [Cronobacter dublinensis]ELQ5994202.1 LysE family transporter [Cronobacter dublinensis]ELQ6229910.1 LysE family transporter [Cronobacter dublinensis]ELY4004794.1 LysE family transporter [Cronobacter dublinensis]ELY4410018.1 LysE family transporter [Cronobacter dublinensis]
MASDVIAVSAIGVAILFGAMSPGVSFLLVARMAMSSSRRVALSVAAGMGFGAAIFAAIALAGLHTLLTLVPSLYTGLKIAGGCYLLWLALKMFRRPSNRFNDSAGTEDISVLKAFMTGVFTQISNPHTALVFASIFSAALSKNIQPVMYIILPTMAFVIDVLWYAVVACLLSTDGPRQAYIKYRKFIDKLSGGVMAFLGIRLLLK